VPADELSEVLVRQGVEPEWPGLPVERALPVAEQPRHEAGVRAREYVARLDGVVLDHAADEAVDR
jgi:hypothetical protein